MLSAEGSGARPVVMDDAPASEPSHAGHSHRLRSLDGLRGVAALIVVFSHAMLASSRPLAAIDLSARSSIKTGSVDWFLSRTPLQILWAGPEMVLIFFVLSGYVLALPAVVRGSGWFDISYYPRRVARLYIPAWIALVFGACLHELHRHPIRGASWWLNDHARSLTISDGLHNATLLFQGSTWAFTTVIWSLRDEIIFSLLLPLVLLAVLWARRSAALSAALAVLCFAVMVIAADAQADLKYMPLFVIGSLMALNIDRLPKSVPRPVFPAVCALCVCLIVTSYMASNQGSGSAPGITYLCDSLGCCLAVWIAVVSTQARQFLTRRPVLWLGSRSYSLYLVHEPIVVAFAFLMGGRHTVLLLIIAVPASLLVAEGFWRVVESPSIRFARTLGRYVARSGFGSPRQLPTNS